MSSFRAAVIGVIGLSAIGSPALAAQAVGDPFDGAYERLRRGPDHLADVPTGRLELTQTNQDGLLHRYVVIVPESYDVEPVRVLWATERTDRYNRAHWVVIDELGPISGDGGRGALAALTADGLSSAVDAVRDGNTVTVEVYHVRRFTVLISPDAFDMRSPIRVIANGEVAFEGMVRPSVETLRKWAASDEDRTMLYAAEITVELEP